MLTPDLIERQSTQALMTMLQAKLELDVASGTTAVWLQIGELLETMLLHVPREKVAEGLSDMLAAVSDTTIPIDDRTFH